jgi:hypothetical protein
MFENDPMMTRRRFS